MLIGGVRPTLLTATETVARVYPLRYLDVEKAAEQVRPLLSPSGGLSVYRSTNSLIVNDLLSNQEQIGRLIGSLDVRRERRRILTVHLDDQDLRDLDLPIVWGDAGGGWGMGRFANAQSSAVRRAVARFVEAVRSRGDRDTSMESLAEEPVEVWVRGRRRTEASLRKYLVRQNYLPAVAPFADVRASLSMISMNSGDPIGGYRVKLLPRLSFRTNADRIAVDLTEVATVLTVPKNEWVLLTGGSATGRDVLTALYGGLPGSRDSGFNFLIRITSVEDP